MTVKQYIIEQLEAHKGEYVSGEELAARIGVSRAAIWKTVQILQGEGYEIHSMPRRGYCLAAESDILSREGILPFLDDRWKKIPIWVHDRLDSTNQEAKRLSAEGAPHGRSSLLGSRPRDAVVWDVSSLRRRKADSIYRFYYGLV